MASFRRSFRWSSDSKKTMTVTVPRSESGFGFTVAWTKPPLVDYIHEGGNAEKAGLMPGDKIMCIDKIKVSKKGKEEIENIVKNVKEIMELEISRPESELATRKRQTSLRRKESFTKKGSKMIIQDCNIMLWRRERALLKLLLCEEDLLTAILHGKEKFIIGLRKRCSLATPMELSILFGNIEEVATVNERCIQQLRQMTQGNDDSIGRLYQKQLDDRCSVLKTYIYGLHLAKILLKYKMSNRPFREFIEGHEKEEGAVEVSKLIEKPVQYIAVVTTQLETLLSCTAVGHRDYVCLESVVSVLKNFRTEMNEVMSKLSCYADFDGAESPYDDEDPYVNLETLQEKALFTKGPRSFSLVYPGRYWLFSGELSKIEGRHYIQYWALLLSDCLILTRRTEQRVLLILDEPVMLRSIYQATFDVKKSDTEFRILFAVENPKKAVGQRNQWLTWILRAPSVGIKLIWQTILTYQLSFYSTEALSTGSKASFVHARPLPGVKELLAKRNVKYEESSFVTLAEGSKLQTSSIGGSVSFDTAVKEPSTNQPKGGKIIFPLMKTADLLREISLRKSKERSYFSLNENFVSANNAESAEEQAFPRSKSFGNDIGDTIPFIDSSEENKDAADKTKDTADQTKDTADQTKYTVDQTKDTADQTDEVFLPNNEGEVKTSDDKEDKDAAEPLSAPDTPSKSDKYVQTDDSSESPEVIKRTPRRRFPRLGTFERIKVEKKNASELNTTSQTVPSHTKTGTSFRHRRHIKTTASKEMLLKSTALSPTNEDRDVSDIAFPDESPAENKKKKGIFSRFWRKESKAPELISVQKENKDVQESNLDEVSKSERPPDYESAVQTGPSWILLNNPLLGTEILKKDVSITQGVLPEETENNNHSNPKWTLTAMEKYMRDESKSSIALGLVSQPPPPPPTTTAANNKRRPVPVPSGHHLVPAALLQNGADAQESGGEESSPSWASSSTGNTPSYGSSGLAFDFGPRAADDAFEKSAPLITTTTCTPKSTPENAAKKAMTPSLSTDLLSALDSDLELVVSKPRKSRKDSQSSVKSEDSRGTPSRTSKLRKLLRRTRSAGCSKDVQSGNSQFSKEKPPVTKTKSADSAPCSREDGDEKLKKSSRKTLAQDMKMRLSFLRRRHTDSSLQPSVRPSPEEAHKWAESFHELTNSKYGLSLFRAFLSREFSEENIDFWLACEDYKRTRPNKLTAKARKIYDDFVAAQAPKEVNIDSSMRTTIYNNLQNPDRHSFDPAQRRIQGLMEQDAYVRFLQSDLYKDLTQGNSTNISS